MRATCEWRRRVAMRLSRERRWVLDIDPQVFGGLRRRCHHAHAVGRISFTSTIPGSTGIVVDIALVEGTYATKTPSRQVGLGLSRVARRCTFVHELLQQCIYGGALSSGFVGSARLGFARNFDTHGLLALRWTSESFRFGRQSSPNREIVT
jgi:hypothetical protein